MTDEQRGRLIEIVHDLHTIARAIEDSHDGTSSETKKWDNEVCELQDAAHAIEILYQ